MPEVWKVIECEDCGATVELSGTHAECPSCGAVYVPSGKGYVLNVFQSRSAEFVFGETPYMSGSGWIREIVAIDPLAF